MSARSANLFIASDYSLAECAFLLQHLGEPPLVALADGTPTGVNELQVQKLLTRTYELEALRAARSIPWFGLAGIKRILQRYLDWMQTTAIMRSRVKGSRDGRVRHAAALPSMCAWDDGRPFIGGIGADSHQIMTAIEASGARTPLYCDLSIPEGQDGAIPDLTGIAPWASEVGDVAKTATSLAESTPSELIVRKHGSQKQFGAFECPLCGKAEEFKQGNQASRSLAMGRMMKHLKLTKDDVDRHRILYARVRDGKPAKQGEDKLPQRREAGRGAASPAIGASRG